MASARVIHWRRSSAIIGTDPVQALLAKEARGERQAATRRHHAIISANRRLQSAQLKNSSQKSA